MIGLEKIYPNSDTGSQAIMKLERNQNTLKQSIIENDNKINVLIEKTVKIYIFESSIDINDFKELNAEWITANNTVSQNCLNTPVDKIPSFNVRNYSLTDSAYLFQELRTFSGHSYFRTYDSYNDIWSDWDEYATVSQINELQTQLTSMSEILLNASTTLIE